MNRRLKKYMDDIDKVEKKIAEYQEQRQVLMAGLKQEQELEMVHTLRSLNLDRRELFSVLNGLQDGTMTIQDLENMEEKKHSKKDGYEKPEQNEESDLDNSLKDDEGENQEDSYWQEGGDDECE